MMILLSILAALFSVFGNILIIFKKRIAFAIWGIGNVLWVWESIIDSLNIPLIAMNVIYFGINCAAYYEWSKNKETHKAIDKSNKNLKV